jgi:hypothetical protein
VAFFRGRKFPARGSARGLIAVLAIGIATLAADGEPFQGVLRGLPTIVVTNGEAAVGEAVVSVALPAGLVGESFIVRGEDDGEAVLAQLMRDRTLAFTVRELAPREVRRLRLEPALDRAVVGPIVARERFDGVELSLDGRPVAGYQTQPSVPLAGDAGPRVGRGGYLHPLRTPAGRVVTDDDVPGRPEQRGLWSAWAATRVDGRTPDFWHTGRGTGAVEFEGVLETWSGPIVAGFRARHRAVDRTVRPPLTAETQTWEAKLPALGRVGPPHRVLDLTIRHEVVIARPIVVAAAAYGGLGLRGPRAWSGGTGMAVVTSEGRTRRNATRSRARWVAMVGLVGGGNAGLAVLDHPDNLRHPQPLFVDGGQPFVSYAAMQSGPITLTMDRDLVLRYRIVTFDGFPDRAWLERLWQAYAHPPRVAFAR